MSQTRPSRGLAAIAFAAVGLVAGAAHVLANDVESLRLWREVSPLAVLVGACVGALARPRDWLSGGLASFLALLVFAVAYGVAEAFIGVGRDEVAGLAEWVASVGFWAKKVLAQAALGGAAATLAGAAMGHCLCRRMRRLSADRSSGSRSG